MSYDNVILWIKCETKLHYNILQKYLIDNNYTWLRENEYYYNESMFLLKLFVYLYCIKILKVCKN